MNTNVAMDIPAHWSLQIFTLEREYYDEKHFTKD